MFVFLTADQQHDMKLRKKMVEFQDKMTKLAKDIEFYKEQVVKTEQDGKRQQDELLEKHATDLRQMEEDIRGVLSKERRDKKELQRQVTLQQEKAHLFAYAGESVVSLTVGLVCHLLALCAFIGCGTQGTIRYDSEPPTHFTDFPALVI